MQGVHFVYWEEDGGWLGYLQEYPDYWTQGVTLDDLKEHLADLYKDLTSGQVPEIRKAELLGCSAQLDAERWDQQFDADVRAGKLDVLAERALQAHAAELSTKL